MIQYPPVAVVLVTYARTDYAVRTAVSVKENLKYAGKLGWYVGDDGSPPEHFDAILDALKGVHIFGSHSEDFVPGQNWPGKSWNIAWEASHDWAPIILFLEDDWKLNEELDITPYVKLLMENEKVGMVRLGHLAINLNCTSMGYDGIHYLQMWRNMPYPFSGNPALRHRRFADAYGPYNERVNPGDTELDYDHRFRHTSGPEIWWPIPCGWGVFAHIGQEQSYHVPE